MGWGVLFMCYAVGLAVAMRLKQDSKIQGESFDPRVASTIIASAPFWVPIWLCIIALDTLMYRAGWAAILGYLIHRS